MKFARLELFAMAIALWCLAPVFAVGIFWMWLTGKAKGWNK